MRYSAQSVSIDRRPGPVFDSPELQARSHRVIYSVMTFAAWIVWAWLWLPLVTLLGWYLGIRTFLREIVIPDRVRAKPWLYLWGFFWRLYREGVFR